MHTVKNKEDISQAYFKLIKHFALDSKDELQKILEATKRARFTPICTNSNLKRACRN